MATTRQPILVNGEVLTWARERWGLDLARAAEQLDLSEEKLAEYENGTHALEAELLERMTKAYELSATNLILRSPPHERDVETDYRTVDREAPHRTTELIQAITTTLVDQESATSLALDLGLEVAPNIPEVTGEEDAESVGATLRELLAVTDAQQRGWNSSAESFRQWRWRVEKLGILVFLRKLTPDEDEHLNCRGFSSYAEGLLPAIVVNANESKEAQCFTLMHELVHLLRRESGICDEGESSDARTVERFCNRAAAATLMPPSLVAERVHSRRLPVGTDWTDEDVKALARALLLSRPAVAIRLEELGLASPGLWTRLGFSRDQDSVPEVRRMRFPKGRSLPYTRRHINRLGSYYVELVFAALDQGLLDLTDADYHLDLRVKHFDSLRSELARAVSESTGGSSARS